MAQLYRSVYVSERARVEYGVGSVVQSIFDHSAKKSNAARLWGMAHDLIPDYPQPARRSAAAHADHRSYRANLAHCFARCSPPGGRNRGAPFHLQRARNRSAGAPSFSPIHTGHAAGSRMTGIRLWNLLISALASVVTIGKVRSTPPAGSRQPSQRPAKASFWPSARAMA